DAAKAAAGRSATTDRPPAAGGQHPDHAAPPVSDRHVRVGPDRHREDLTDGHPVIGERRDHPEVVPETRPGTR
ncbi:hypothetical protein ACFYXS_01545, partial [Streptomyces sp. NPDC002574]|uniref:hypothetical protein n=1 Tax=Streptomyces sp. NPDC002574 TaxID=3364652 RepID=UPI0036AA825A